MGSVPGGGTLPGNILPQQSPDTVEESGGSFAGPFSIRFVEHCHDVVIGPHPYVKPLSETYPPLPFNQTGPYKMKAELISYSAVGLYLHLVEPESGLGAVHHRVICARNCIRVKTCIHAHAGGSQTFGGAPPSFRSVLVNDAPISPSAASETVSCVPFCGAASPLRYRPGRKERLR